MPGIKCKCGQVIKYGSIPNENEWLTISDVEYDQYSGTVDSEDLYSSMKSVLKCSACERLLVFLNGFDSPPTYYKLELSRTKQGDNLSENS